ncbi:MAG: caspase family protein, partial [Fimbriimonadales bacterium]
MTARTRVLLTGLILCFLPAARADRYALLVAIDSYPIVQGRQLSGSDYDLRLMRKMLEFYNFQTDQLAHADATRVAIITKLAKLAQVAKQGDDFVFYFSGRGSIAPPVDKPTAKVQMEPTLVPYDGKETITDFDLRMKRIEDWADEITKKGGSVTVIVDASFQSATRDDVGRPYNPMPRTIRRKATMDGEVREEPYLGPGIYIAATPSGGSAYEYLINASSNTWDGAFTDLFVNEVIGELHKGTTPTYSGVMREVQAYIKDKVRQDYMPGLAPYPPAKTLVAQAEVYDKPMFGGVTPSAIPPKQQADIQQ